jgi:hypothetical protein
VRLLIEYGEDPDVPRYVRPGILFDQMVHVTPLEAAVAARDTSVLTQLLALGATLDADVWNRLRCLADDDKVPAVLDARRPEGATLLCEGFTLPW